MRQIPLGDLAFPISEDSVSDIDQKQNLPSESDATGSQSAITWDASEFPWWLVAMVAIIIAMGFAILTNEEFGNAFDAIFPVPLRLARGIGLTLILTGASFIISVFVGLVIALLRMSQYKGWRWYWMALFVGTAIAATALISMSAISTVAKVILLVIFWGVALIGSRRQDIAVVMIRNSATLYIEFVRGVPMLVWIFTIALVLVPSFTSLLDLQPRAVNEAMRATVALSMFYAAFIAEVFRAGIQSVPVGQIEAGKAVGLTDGQILRHITLPQAIRNMLPALGNDLIALMKDTSLVSVLAVNELTQMARLYAGSSFRFRESYFVLVILYVSLTLILSLLLRWYEKRIMIPGGV
jgi:polar amino acid transport system permease protein